MKNQGVKEELKGKEKSILIQIIREAQHIKRYVMQQKQF